MRALKTCGGQIENSSPQKVKEDTANIFDTIKRIIDYATQKNINMWLAANHMAEKRLQSIAKLKNFYL